jgi:hypothetical protein
MTFWHFLRLTKYDKFQKNNFHFLISLMLCSLFMSLLFVCDNPLNEKTTTKLCSLCLTIKFTKKIYLMWDGPCVTIEILLVLWLRRMRKYVLCVCLNFIKKSEIILENTQQNPLNLITSFDQQQTKLTSVNPALSKQICLPPKK